MTKHMAGLKLTVWRLHGLIQLKLYKYKNKTTSISKIVKDRQKCQGFQFLILGVGINMHTWRNLNEDLKKSQKV